MANHHAQKSRCITATAFIILINFHSTVEIFQKISRGMSLPVGKHTLSYGRRIRRQYVLRLARTCF